MDPITQGAFGAVFAQTYGKRKDLAKAAIIGGLAGLAPDLDVLIRSSHDSLLALEYHRQFTHSLLFAPFGGLLCSLVFHPLLGRRFGFSFKQTLIWCVIGFFTHGIVDAFTSYGTQLLWPITEHRFAWDSKPIVDPLVTLPILALIIFAARKKLKRYVIIALAWIVFYFGLGEYQLQRALDEGQKLAESRGLMVENIEVKPSFANILIWKLITTTKDSYYIDAVKIGWNKTKIWEGDSVQKLSVERDLPWLDVDSQQRKDIERFRWFSKGYIALDKNNPNRVVDMRYSLLPQEIEPMWGIELSTTADADQHAQYYVDRLDPKGATKVLWKMLWE